MTDINFDLLPPEYTAKSEVEKVKDAILKMAHHARGVLGNSFEGLTTFKDIKQNKKLRRKLLLHNQGVKDLIIVRSNVQVGYSKIEETAKGIERPENVSETDMQQLLSQIAISLTQTTSPSLNKISDSLYNTGVISSDILDESDMFGLYALTSFPNKLISKLSGFILGPPSPVGNLSWAKNKDNTGLVELEYKGKKFAIPKEDGLFACCSLVAMRKECQKASKVLMRLYPESDQNDEV